jgi:hypothetical protein
MDKQLYEDQKECILTLDKHNKELKGALERYGKHDRCCEAYGLFKGMRKCTCGFRKVLLPTPTSDKEEKVCECGGEVEEFKAFIGLIETWAKEGQLEGHEMRIEKIETACRQKIEALNLKEPRCDT